MAGQSSSKYYLLIVFYCIRFASIVLAIETAAAGGIAFWVGMKISSAYGISEPALGGLWAAISVFMVVCAEEKRAFVSAWNRVMAVFVGVVLAGALASWLGYGVGSFMLTLLASVIIVSLLKKKVCFRTATVSVAIIYLFGYIQPNISIWWSCLGRFSESVTGIFIALIFLLIFHPVRFWLASVRKRFNLEEMEPF